MMRSSKAANHIAHCKLWRYLTRRKAQQKTNEAALETQRWTRRAAQVTRGTMPEAPSPPATRAPEAPPQATRPAAPRPVAQNPERRRTRRTAIRPREWHSSAAVVSCAGHVLAGVRDLIVSTFSCRVAVRRPECGGAGNSILCVAVPPAHLHVCPTALRGGFAPKQALKPGAMIRVVRAVRDGTHCMCCWHPMSTIAYCLFLVNTTKSVWQP